MSKENSSHAMGSESDFGGERQRHMMASGKGPMAGDGFGIGEIPGSRRIPGERGHEGKVLSDGERGTRPAIKTGAGSMRATAHSDHGPHRNGG